MFSNASRIIKDAADKAAAQEAPSTFLGRRGHGSMSTEVDRGLALLVDRLGESGVARVVDCALRICMGEVLGDGCVSELASGLSLEEADCGLIATCCAEVLRAAVRKRIHSETIIRDLTALGVSAPIAQVFASKISSHRADLEAVGVSGRIQPPRLSNLRWRCNVALSTSDLKSVAEPTVELQMTLSDGTIRVMEMSLDKFHLLRYNVAKVLSQMNQLEGHPMMKIMDVLAMEERKKL